MKRALLVILVAFLGCGEDGEPSRLGLEGFLACGGDVVGSWGILESSLPDTALPMGNGCTVTLAVDVTASSGTYVFENDGTFEYDITRSGVVRHVITAACYTNPDTELCEPFGSAEELEDVEFTCDRLENKDCRCESIEEQVARDEDVGTFTAADNELAFVYEGGEDIAEYCVSGDELLLRIAIDEGDELIRLKRE